MFGRHLEERVERLEHKIGLILKILRLEEKQILELEREIHHPHATYPRSVAVTVKSV